jgi:hypothetical protein
MTTNYYQIETGDRKRGLKFNNRTMDFIEKITGKDAFQFQPAFVEGQNPTYKALVDFATTIIHAALLSNCASKKEEPDFSADDVAEWVNELAPADIYKATDAFRTLVTPDIKTDVAREGNADTQPPA